MDERRLWAAVLIQAAKDRAGYTLEAGEEVVGAEQIVGNIQRMTNGA